MNRSNTLSFLNDYRSRVTGKPIERLVCSGGGAKGIVYSGSHKALEDTGVLKEVRQIAGTSAGSMTAAFMAVGMESLTLRNILLATPLTSLLGDSVGSLFGHHAPGICFITKDGIPLENFIRQSLMDAVKVSLQKIKNLEQLAAGEPALHAVIEKLYEPNSRFTFADLGVLSDHFPQQFKQLIVPAARFPEGTLQIFNRELTPDVEIALACRASSSIPVLLKPVDIYINGKKQTFVDGGLFDNLPSDYFDSATSSLFSKNVKPFQTLVLAFGDHTKDNENRIHKALYTSRWDEVISDALLEKIVEMAIHHAKHVYALPSELNSFENQKQMVMHAIQCILQQRVRQAKMPREQARAINQAVKEAFEVLSLDCSGNSTEQSAHEVSQLIKEKMRPLLSDVGVLSQLKYNIFLETIGDLDLNYSYAKQNEAGFQKIRSEYPLRTVELRVGNISTFDFDDATRHARILDAFGYLDTVNYITNHDLHDEQHFNEGQFYLTLMHHFESIYQAVLQGAGKNAHLNELTQSLNSLRHQLTYLGKSEAVICRQLYYLVKSMAEKRLDSMEAFVLSRAVEFHNQTIDADTLFKEVYEEGFKHSGMFSTAHITGERFFRSDTLHETLKNKRMMELYQHKSTHSDASRADRVFHALNKIDMFRKGFEDSQLNCF